MKMKKFLMVFLIAILALSIWSSLAWAAAGDMLFLRSDGLQLVLVNLNKNVVARYSKQGEDFIHYATYIIDKISNGDINGMPVKHVRLYNKENPNNTFTYNFKRDWSAFLHGGEWKRVQ